MNRLNFKIYNVGESLIFFTKLNFIPSFFVFFFVSFDDLKCIFIFDLGLAIEAVD